MVVQTVDRSTRPVVGASGRQWLVRVGIGVLALVVVGAAGMAWWARAHPTVEFQNRLLVPVVVSIGDGEQINVKPGAVTRVEVSRSVNPRVTWTSESLANEPASESGSIPVTGVGMLQFPGNPFEAAVMLFQATDGSLRYFAPLVSNATNGPLCLLINAPAVERAGDSARDCDAIVPAAAATQFVGYFPLSASSSVRAVDALGRGTTYRGFERLADGSSGRLVLRFAPADFEPH
ncbi:MAG: hypothetical protein ABI748_08925 [Dokdonella sp.]